MQSNSSIYTIAQIRQIEKYAYSKLGIAPQDLMQRAGKAAFDFLLQKWPDTKKILIFCGGGNNGGDGYIVAKCAHDKGLIVTIIQVGTEGGSDETKAAIASAKQDKIEIYNNLDSINLQSYDLIVDSLLGIGFENNQLKEPYANIVKEINASGKEVLSIDTPSGLNADTGSVSSPAIFATATITFIAQKRGLLTGHSRDYCGQIVVSNLHLPDKAFNEVATEHLSPTIENILELLPKKSQCSYKNQFGHVLVVGGNYGYGGAPILAALGALRSGAGLVSVATRHNNVPSIIAHCPEIMAHGVEKSTQLAKLIETASIIVLGPGLSNAPYTRDDKADHWINEMFETTIQSDKPTIVDAGALELLSKNEHLKHNNLILTPHPGEAGKLLGITTAEIEMNRFNAISALKKKYNATVILKGAGTLIQGKSCYTSICQYGNYGMASGGMGDLLSGCIAAIRCITMDNEKAAIIATNLHSYAADQASIDGCSGMIATDLLPIIRRFVC